MCCICEKHSVTVAKSICFNQKENISMKDYLVKMALLCGVLLGSVGLLLACIKLFGGLFN
jgi:hypothetical protein